MSSEDGRDEFPGVAWNCQELSILDRAGKFINTPASYNSKNTSSQEPCKALVYTNAAAHNQHLGVLSGVGGIKVLKQSESDHFSDCKHTRNAFSLSEDNLNRPRFMYRKLYYRGTF